MALKEPLKFLGIIKKLVKRTTQSNDIDVILTIEVSDSMQRKAEVLHKLADTEAMEYFEVIIRNEGKRD